jgi:hypothetical protein
MSPLVVAEATSQVPFRDIVIGPDTLVAYGGCPVLNDFDVIMATGGSTEEMTYSDTDGDGAVIAQTTTNAQGNPARVVLSGFSYHTIRDDRVAGNLDRAVHLRRILLFFRHIAGGCDAPDKHQYINALYQNYPNPFNPATTIKYSIKERARVSLKIYNVAGQLVRTLIDREQHPSEVRPVVWDGRNDRGNPVASGVYFYKLATKGFTSTKKMVILK